MDTWAVVRTPWPGEVVSLARQELDIQGGVEVVVSTGMTRQTRDPRYPGLLDMSVSYEAYRVPSVSDSRNPHMGTACIQITDLCRRACSREPSDLGLSNEKD